MEKEKQTLEGIPEISLPQVGDMVLPIGFDEEWEVIEVQYNEANHNILVANKEKEMWIAEDAIHLEI